MTDTEKIQKTASTLFEISRHSDVPFASDIAKMMEEMCEEKWAKIENVFSPLLVSRFLTTQSLIDLFSEKYGQNLQIIELGAGFTPHYLNIK